MGYTTDFEGSVRIEPALNADEISFLSDLATTRRMNRKKGPLFVKGGGFHGQGEDLDIIDFNNSDKSQPGLWLQWIPSEDGTQLSWDDGEKFYDSASWMEYLIERLLTERGRQYVKLATRLSKDERLNSFTFDHVVNGTIEAQGEAASDQWTLRVKDNRVTTIVNSVRKF